MKDTAIVWLRRDLRLRDNPALHHALQRHDQVVLAFIYAPDEEHPWQPGAASRWWLHHSLKKFQKALNQCDAELVIRVGDSAENLISLCTLSEAKTVYWNRLYEPALVSRDTEIKEQLATNGIQAHSFNGGLLREPWEIHKDDGSMYRVYTPFSKKYLQLPEIDSPIDPPLNVNCRIIDGETANIDQLSLLPKKNWDSGFYDCWQPGEAGAFESLQDFLERALMNYAEGRDLPGIDGVSGLSPHLHFGEISPRQVWHEVQFHAAQLADEGLSSAKDSALPYLKQLIWRDFAHHILFHLPHTSERPFNSKFDAFDWEHDPQLLEAWQRGHTGIPLVDAGMRQLWNTGWMHNRVRMLVASLLCKNGLVHWLEGARWFWDTLVDADLANNSMGWQWTAGCGVDAAPYFRIFSPARQGQRFDPEGLYIKKWVPELYSLPSKYIHEPWLAPKSVLEQSNIVLNKHYPAPVLDLSKTRVEALARFKRLRNS
jgi:deoxyribodipyrimidine photo-lyase